MGMNLDGPLFLQQNGWLTARRNRILDVGPQTVYNLRPEQVREFIERQGGSAADRPDELDKKINRLVYFSTPRPGERTTMLSEITDLTNIEYASIDVCPGLKNTEILDLNFDQLPDRMCGYYDVVFNFGTTEHILNQWNCLEVIHDALAVGGVVYHQLPASGYLDHGYFCYTPLLFRDLAAANDYVIEDLAVTPASESRIDGLGIRSIGGESLRGEPRHLGENNRVPALNMHVILRKTKDVPFQASLEIATAHAPPSARILGRYQGVEDELKAIMASRSWRYTQPLRSAVTAVRSVLKRGLNTSRPVRE